MPKRTTAQSFQIRLPPDILAKIDTLIDQEKFTTRSDFMKQAAIWFLNQAEYQKNIRMQLIDLIRDDPEIMERIRDSTVEEVIRRLQATTERKTG